MPTVDDVTRRPAAETVPGAPATEERDNACAGVATGPSVATTPLTPDHARERVFQSRITAAMEHAITALNAYPDDRQRALLFCDLAIDAIARAKEDS